jgi:hypothetical protein
LVESVPAVFKCEEAFKVNLEGRVRFGNGGGKQGVREVENELKVEGAMTKLLEVVVSSQIQTNIS